MRRQRTSVTLRRAVVRMLSMRDIHFGVNVHAVLSGQEFTQLVRRVDEVGYDVFAAPDHLGALSPFAVLPQPASSAHGCGCGPTCSTPASGTRRC